MTARRLMLVPLLLALASAAAMAQEVRQYRAGDSVDPREVAAILGQPGAPKMRSIRLLDDQAGTLAAAAPPKAVADTQGPSPGALSLPVQFAFDSADILASARQQLDALAEGIRMLPPRNAIVIQGHTDASGPEQYNEQLSQRRAQAVKRYLVATHGIDPARLRAVGLGEYAPLAGHDPYAAENRRVQFRGE